ncbi:hypothetical protein F4604DRAFT_1675193 [Suillus subluteus]|nr:hypothetical protein F4604DRAFT_1675193 [Suillus subluteus]
MKPSLKGPSVLLPSGAKGGSECEEMARRMSSSEGLLSDDQPRAIAWQFETSDPGPLERESINYSTANYQNFLIHQEMDMLLGYHSQAILLGIISSSRTANHDARHHDDSLSSVVQHPGPGPIYLSAHYPTLPLLLSFQGVHTEISTNAYTTVQTAMWKFMQTLQVAVKAIRPQFIDDKMFWRELGIWRRLRHRNILELMGTTRRFSQSVALVAPVDSQLVI